VRCESTGIRSRKTTGHLAQGLRQPGRRGSLVCDPEGVAFEYEVIEPPV